MTVEPSKIIFEERFQDNHHQWYIKESEECVASFGSNHYLFEHKRENGYWLAWNSSEFENFYENPHFRIQVILEKMHGPDCGFGIVWQLSDVNNYREFVISEQYYRIYRKKNGVEQIFVSWQRCSHLKPANSINVLEIRRNDSVWEFYINSLLIETLPVDTELSGTRFGFIIYSNIKIKVHSVLITTSSPADKSNTQQRNALQSTCTVHLSPDDDSLEAVFADLNALIGHHQIKQQFNTLANFLKVQAERKSRGLPTVRTPLHLVLCGPPGTGKTTVARIVGRLYKQLGCLKSGHVIEIDRAGLIGGYIGQTALRVEHAIERADHGILFIDEVYSLIGHSSNDFGHEAIQILLKRMEDYRDHLAVIVAGYSDPMKEFIDTNPGLQSRFTRWFHLDHYAPNDLTLIFEKFCHDHGYVLEASAHLALQATFETAHSQRDKNFGNGRFARTLFEQSIEKQANRIVNGLEKVDNTAISLITAADLGIDDSTSD